jgi:hypothetical protein
MTQTPADLLVQALNLPALPDSPVPIPGGGWCAISGQPILSGYPVSTITSGATAEFLDTFHGDCHGYVSENAARCYKNADPRKGNPTARSFLVFQDGPAYQPLIAREPAIEQGRPCWSIMVREVWPVRRGQICLVLLTTDTKKRLWPRTRVGALGTHTPVYLHNSETAISQIVWINWHVLVNVLGLVEEVYTAGFSKSYIRTGLYGATKAVATVGYRQMQLWEQALYGLRPLAEFEMATLIAQKKEEP